MIKEDIIKLLIDIIDNEKYSNLQLNYFFKIKNYNQKEKNFVNNMINIVLKNLIYIDHILFSNVKKVQKKKIKYLLRISIAQIYFGDKDIKGIINEAVEIAKRENIHQSKFVKYALNQVILNKDKIENDLIKNSKYDILYSYPKWLYDKIKKEYKDEYVDVLKAYKEKSIFSVRINSNKITKEKFIEILEKIDTKILFEVYDVFYLSNNNIVKTNYYLNGDIVIQDASSYLVVKNLNCNKDDIVIDACSAPGGKMLAISQMYDVQKITAVDIYEHKINILNDLKEKYEIDNLEILKGDFVNLDLYNKYYSKILLDVPCSGIGVLRKKPEKIYSLTNKNLQNIINLQYNILKKGYSLLSENGEIMYSTCTILKEENTQNIKRLLNEFKDLKVQKLNFPDNIIVDYDELGGAYISHKNKYLDGFYMIKLKKE